MVTSVEEDSSFPLPIRTHYGALLGGDITCYRVCVERQNPNISQPWLPHSVCYPRSPAAVPLGSDPQAELEVELQAHCPQVSIISAKLTEKKEDHVLADPLFFLINNQWV